MSSFLRINDLQSATIKDILETALDIKKAPEKYERALEKQHFAMLFEKPSLRTRASFSVGIEKMGGVAHFFNMQQEKIGTRESVHDLANNLEQWYQGVIARVDSHSTLADLNEHASIPVINALCDQHHPCQALADALTLFEINANFDEWCVAYLGDFNNVARSLVDVAVQLGFHLTLVTPKNSMLDNFLNYMPFDSADNIQWIEDPAELERCNVIYTDVWQSMGAKKLANNLSSIYQPYQVNQSLMSQTKAEFFMHCQPVHRGEEVTAEVCDSDKSIMYQQARNRMTAQQALLFLMFNGRLK
ncbi:MAG: ornithine carbamoyltransferase [Gammaproteobacteria bacterium]|nr:ornithine carbamoyltransferase [Gammaproteobacteria bacterium]